MLPGETIATGCPSLCPECNVEVLPLRVLHSSAGYFIGTRCACAAVYSRESDYYPTQAQAELALTARSFGRGGIPAADVDAYWTNRVDPRPFRITVLHRQPGPPDDWTAGGRFVRVFELPVHARTPEAACEVAFAVANSAPGELRCEPRYASHAAAYRAAGLRALAVGDVLVAHDDAGTDTTWECAPRGFAHIAGVPGPTANPAPAPRG